MTNKKGKPVVVNTSAGKMDGRATKNNSAGKGYFSGRNKFLLLLAVVALLVYANTLKNGYVLDDYGAIVKNTIVVKGITAIPELLSTPYHQGFNPSPNDLYRPLSLVMFAIEYQVFGAVPAAGHFINILLFAGCVIALFVFLDNLFEGKKTGVSFLASLLFAVHPIHTEVVANIKSRDELLCFFLALASLNLFMRYMSGSRMKFLLAGAFCFFLSLLSKETTVTFLAVIPLVFFFYRNDNKQRAWYISGISLLVFVVYFGIRSHVLKTYHSDNMAYNEFIDNILVKSPSVASRMATCMLVLGHYIRLLFVPYPLLCDYSYNTIPFAHFNDTGVIISLAIYLFLAAYGLARLIKNPKDPVAFGILFFLITISLFSNMPFLIGALMAERFVFFASAGFCLVLVLLAAQLHSKYAAKEADLLKSRKIWMLAIPVLLVFSIMTIMRNEDWVDNYTLFSTDSKKSPENSRLYEYEGNELVSNIFGAEEDMARKKQALDAGIPVLQKALAIYPDFSGAQEDIGHAFFMIGQIDSAEAHDKRALALNPRSTIALSNIAGVYYTRNNYAEALACCKRAILLSPGNTDILRNTGRCYMAMKQYDSVIVLFKNALVKDPGNSFFNGGISEAYKGLGRMDSANKYAALAR